MWKEVAIFPKSEPDKSSIVKQWYFLQTPAFDGSSRTPMYHTGRTPTYQGASTPYYSGSASGGFELSENSCWIFQFHFKLRIFDEAVRNSGRTPQHGSSTPWYERESGGKSTSTCIKGAGER